MNNNNKLTRFDEGKLHSQNPNGGIKIGDNALVEQGETLKNNFVYSNRIFLDANTVSQYNLPKSLVGKSVADATKMIDDKFKGRNDKISQSTKNGMLSKIAEAQEAMKPAEPEMEQSQEGMIDPTQMALGGYVNRQMSGGGWYDQNNPYFMQNPGAVQEPAQSNTNVVNQIQPVSQLTQANSLSQTKPFSTGNQLPTASAVPDTAGAIGGGLKEMSGKTGSGLSSALGAASTAIDLGKTAFGKPAQDTSGLAPSAKVNSGGMIAGSAMKGASAGMAFGPWGAVIGAVVGAGAGLLGSGKAKKAALKNSNNFARRTNAQFSDQYALGGEILNPIDPIKVLAAKQGISSSPVNENPLFNTKRIVKYQPGVTNDKLGRGFYLYSKDNTQPGFDPNRDREFIKQSEMLAVQRTPEWKEYMRNQSIQPKQFAMGGNIKKYEDGGYYDKNNPYFMTNPGPVIPLNQNIVSSNKLVPFPKPPTADYSTDVLKNMHDIIGITSDTPGYGKLWSKKSDAALLEWQKTNQPDKYAKNSKDKVFSLFPLDTKNTPKQNGEAVRKFFGSEKDSANFQKAAGFTPEGYRFTPKTPILPQRQNVEVTPTQTLAGFEAYADAKQAEEAAAAEAIKNKKSIAGKALSYNNDNLGNIARYAPIAANALQLAQLKKPQGERLDRLGNRYKPEYVDETSLQNIANQTMNNTINAISQSGASEGQIRSSILGSQLQRTKALSDAYSNVAAQNRATDDRAQTFNLGVDQVNLQQSNTEKENFAKDKGNYDTQKSKLIGKIGENIGNVGNEQAYKKIAITTTGYNWLAEYQKANPTATAEEAVTAAKKAGVIVDDAKTAKKNALGGYLIKNKVK